MSKLFAGLTRSELMSRIRSRGNKKTELALVALLRANKIKGWRRHQPLPGCPDFLFPKHRLAVFVDGCFWHACPKHCKKPTGNRPFWEKKFAANKARDRRVNHTLRKAGWRVVRVWEHDLAKRGEACVRRIKLAIAKAG